MHRRKLGALDVSAIALGAPIYDAADDAEVSELLGRALEAGVDFIDTSDAYQNGTHEPSVGRALKGRRDKFIVATKFGNTRDAAGKPGVNGRPEYVVEACEMSLRQLQTDVIDLYYIHRIDQTVPIEDTVGAMAKLKQQGKIRHLGISEAAPATLKRAHATHPIAALQTEYSLWSREPEDELLDLCGELGIGFVAYSPLGRGFLSGVVTETTTLEKGDLRFSHPRFQPENMKRNAKLVEDLSAIAKTEGCSNAQLSLAWLLMRRDFVVPVPGTRQVNWLVENAQAADIKLSAASLAALDKLFARGAVAGERYPPGLLSRVHI